ncbi:MAG: alpha-glucosidase [Clostridia bacterium]|nr:alpha-glucosidase [Clostridia bacterium]
MVRISKTADTLSLFYNDREVYHISVGEPFFYIGIGDTDYKMSHGSFKISESFRHRAVVKVKRIELSDGVATLFGNTGSVRIECEQDRFKFTPCGFKKYNRMLVRIPAAADEAVYGGGENFTEFNLHGKRLNVWVAEHINGLQIGKKLAKQIVGIKNSERKQALSKYETYYAQPTFISSKKYYYHSLTTARCVFDFGYKNEWNMIRTDALAPFYIGFGESFEALMQNLSEVLGRQPELPDWVYDGMILGVQGGTQVMLDKLATAEKAGIPVNGLWIQDWEGRRVTAVGKQLFWNWEWDSTLYPGLDKEIPALGARGIKVLGYINPFLAVEKPLYKEASAKGYCVKNKAGEDYLVTITTFPAAMVDLTNPDAYAWIKQIIKENMIDFGFSGWMADFGEYLPTDCVLYSGENPELVHNTWPARWAQANREAVEESGKLGEIMFFTRAGYSATPRYSTMMWCGDNHVDFSKDFGLPSVIPAMLNLTCCGFGLSHSDIGGYTSFFNLMRSEELYMRWSEMNAFSPLMRGHEGLNPDINAQFDASETVLAHDAKMTKIHTALAPYLKQLVKENAASGLGVVRPLFFHYDEPQAYEEAYEYLLGRDLLVAPVLKPGVATRTVYLPQDEWIHLHSGKEYGGGIVEVPAPLGEIPVFVRKSAAKLQDILMRN